MWEPCLVNYVPMDSATTVPLAMPVHFAARTILACPAGIVPLHCSNAAFHSWELQVSNGSTRWTDASSPSLIHAHSGRVGPSFFAGFWLSCPRGCGLSSTPPGSSQLRRIHHELSLVSCRYCCRSIQPAWSKTRVANPADTYTMPLG